MTREEQIEKAAKKYVKDIVTPLPASLMTAFIKGAEYADQNPVNYDGKAMLHVLNKGVKQGYKDAVEKAFEWINGFLDYSELIEYQVSQEKHEEVIKDFIEFISEQEEHLHMKDYRRPTLVFHCPKCGKPYMIQALANGCDPKEIMDAVARNEKLEIYYGDVNPLNDGCKCVEEEEWN